MRKIFGTSTLHWLSKKSRDKIIDTALNNGFSQFDTSSVYGLGATNKYLGSLGLSKDTKFSAKIGLTSSKNFSSSRLEFLIRKIIFYNASKIEKDNCYSNWQRQFETQMIDLGVSKFQRLLLHERYITPVLWDLFKKFVNQYKNHFDEYGVSANWLTLRPTIRHVYDKKAIIQTTPDVLSDNNLNDLSKITLYGISKVYDKKKYINYNGKINGVIYFSTKTVRIQNVFTDE